MNEINAGDLELENKLELNELELEKELELNELELEKELELNELELENELELNELKLENELEIKDLNLDISGVFNHKDLKGRDASDQHPISAITGLQEALDNSGKIEDVLVNGESVVANKIANIDLTNYVEKEIGKGLSTNDYTNEEKEKLGSLYNYDDTSIKNRLDDIEEVIPNQATSENQLADKEFVNSSIATNTATFRGTYNSTSELPTTGITNNDYAFIKVMDEIEPTEVKQYDRYKWDGTTWVFEYTLNNSSFTANQWEAINSGITSENVEKLNNIDLTDYVKNTDYANSTTGGVIKTSLNFGTNVVSGNLVSTTKTYQQYQSANNASFISKGTLENVLNALKNWKREEVIELPETPSQETIYIQRSEGKSALYNWTYQNRIGYKFFKDEEENLIGTPVSLNNVEWEITSQVGGYYLGSNNTYMYQQFGSGSKPYTELVLESQEEWQDITSIDVFTAGASHNTDYVFMNCKVEIGDGTNWTELGEQEIGKLTNNYCNKLIFENNTGITEGFVRISFTQDAGKALYLNSISINTILPVTPNYYIYTDNEWYKLNTMENTINQGYYDENTPNDLEQTYTESQLPDLGYSGGEMHLINKNGERIGKQQTPKWASSAGNTIYAHKAQYDVDDDKIIETYATDLDLDEKILKLYAKPDEDDNPKLLKAVDLSDILSDNNYTNEDKAKVDYIDDTGDGDYFLSNDGSYYPISSGDIRIPTITVTSVIKNGGKYIRLNFGAYSKEFENYVRENGIQIHLFRYKRNSLRTWNDKNKNQQKKWIHPSNQIEQLSEPARQCWGIGCYKYLIGEDEFYNQIDNANYVIQNEGVVQSEFTLNYSDFAKGYMEIPLDDIMKCIVKCKGYVGIEDTDMKLPSLTGQYSTELVKLIGGQQSKRRSRMHQPIKYHFALPIVTPRGITKYQYGECTNTGVIELMTKRNLDASLGYSNGAKGFLPNVYYGLIIR